MMATHPTAPIRMLLVEDDPDDAKLLLRELRQNDLDVEHRRVASETELRDALDEAWDVVVSDYSMPGFDGLRAAELVREHDAETPFIFVSGVIGQERAIKAMRAGVRDYLPKENLARLSVALRREVDSARQRERERRRVERARDFSQSVVAAFPTPVIIVDSDGLVVASNPAFESTFGRTPALGEDTFESICGEVARDLAVRAALERAHVGQDTREIGVDLNGPDDGPRHLIVRVRALPTKSVDVPTGQDTSTRDVPYALVAIQDITDQRRMYDNLVTAQRLESVGRLAGGVAHDFNNMLTIIQNFALILSEGDFSRQSPNEIGELILEVSERAATLTSQLLAFGRRQPQKLDVTDLNELVRDVAPVVRRLLHDDVKLVRNLADDLADVRVDRRHIEQVIFNLVSNANDAMPDGGTLTIETSNDHVAEGDARAQGAPAGDWVVLEVRDDGKGMPADVAKKAFEPFFTTREFGEGAGLGLSTVYGTIRQIGGHVSIASRPGEGTTVFVSLPARGSVDVDDPAVTTTPLVTVLVVEDDQLVRRSTVRILQRSRFECLEAPNAEAALDLLREAEVDVVVTDVLLPGMNGIELARRVRELENNPPEVILASGYTEDDLDSFDDEFTFIQKPFRPAHLVKAILAVCREK